MPFFPITNAEDWVCPCGRKREVLGAVGRRQLRCVVCEGYGGPFLTKQDHEWLKSICVVLETPPNKHRDFASENKHRDFAPCHECGAKTGEQHSGSCPRGAA